MKQLLSILAIFLALQHALPAQVSDEQLVRQTTDEVLRQLEQHREQLQRDPLFIRQLVEGLIIPQFDIDRMAQLVLGGYWEELDAEGQGCFIEGYRNLLVERYAYVLLAYDGHRIHYEPTRDIGELGYRQVRQVISSASRPPLPIDYAMQESGDSWKVVDLVIDGVSLVRNYRGMFQSRIHLHGLDYFISDFAGCGGGPDTDR